MAISVVRLGSAREPNEGPRLGTVRRPPRAVRKEDFATGDWFDIWLPDLVPTAVTVKWAMSEPWTAARWEKFALAYRREMRAPEQQRLIALLAAVQAGQLLRRLLLRGPVTLPSQGARRATR